MVPIEECPARVLRAETFKEAPDAALAEAGVEKQLRPFHDLRHASPSPVDGPALGVAEDALVVALVRRRQVVLPERLGQGRGEGDGADARLALGVGDAQPIRAQGDVAPPEVL